MRFTLFFIIIPLHIFALDKAIQEKLEQYPSPYQDVFINGSIYQNGARGEESARYKLICKLLKKYNRPFSVLDVGAAEGYFSFRIANDFNAVCVMAEGDRFFKIDRLQHLCEWNTSLDNIIFLAKGLTTYDVKKFLDKENHFDVIILMNILEHMDSWKDVIDIFSSISDYLIIENPHDSKAINAKNCQEIRQFLISQNPQLLGTFSRRHSGNKGKGELYLLKSKTKKSINNSKIKLVSDFDEKLTIKNNGTVTRWVPGISLHTYLALNGSYPHRDFLRKSLLASNHKFHDDPLPKNCIITRGGIKWIDRGEKSLNIRSFARFAYTLESLKCLNQKKYIAWDKNKVDWVDKKEIY